jgi:hypothetical protein
MEGVACAVVSSGVAVCGQLADILSVFNCAVS